MGGKPKGQVKITIKPNSSLPSCLPLSFQSQNVNDILSTSPHHASPPALHGPPCPPATTDIADTEGESLSFMELALSNHLQDLNLMTNKLATEYNEKCDKDGVSKSSSLGHPLLCELDVIDEYLKMSRQLLSPSVPQTDRSDKSRQAPEGGNAE